MTIFKGMTRDPSSLGPTDLLDSPTTICRECGSVIRVGSWPWCRGDFRRHWRDFNDHTAAEWAEVTATNSKRPNTAPPKDA